MTNEEEEMKYIIVGNGIAGLSAAEEIRKEDKEGEITIISSEEYLSYYRVKLSHYINKLDFKLSELLIHDEKWYEEKNIDMLLNIKVDKIDEKNKAVITKQGEIIKYDKLLLANGSNPFIPPVLGVDKGGVFALRTIDDLKEIQSYLRGCKTVSVIGGGLLGLEAAWALKNLDKEVNVIEFFPYLLPRQLDKELGIYLQSKLEREGLNFYLDSATKEIEGDTEVSSIRLKDNTKVKSDAVLISTGVRPNISIVQGTDIKTDKGIIVDKFMRTNIKDIYAAGDVAQFENVVMGLWSAAMDQGKIAGANMVGKNRAYSLPQPSTMLNIGSVKMFSVGKVNDVEKDIVIKGDNFKHKLFVDNGKLVGGVLFGNLKKMISLKKAVNEKKDISDLINSGLKPEEILDKI